MESVLKSVNAVVWGVPVLLLILIVGVLLTIRSKFAQICLLPKAIKQLLLSLKHNRNPNHSVSGYRALCTALAATVGTGNIAGVAGAIAIGGPGVIFWMWICAILGMITKCAEVTLALHFREKSACNGYVGGPMYIIKNGLREKFRALGYIYCFFGVVAALGIGNAVQVNAVIDSMKSVAELICFPVGKTESFLVGIVITVLIVPAFCKGAVGIGGLAEKLVPAASLIYIALCTAVIYLRAEYLPAVFHAIMKGAFQPSAVTGGLLGSMFITLRVGVSRGIFTNEAGMGTASIAHAAAEVTHPLEQGLMGIMEVFLDTVVICTLTALVILSSNVTIPFGTDPGITLTMEAFSKVLGNWTKPLLSGLSGIFAFATILGWGLYGIRCFQYLFGEYSGNIFVVAQSVAVILGSVIQTSTVWLFSEIVNGLMAIPNLIAILMLMKVFLELLNQYKDKAYSYQ